MLESDNHTKEYIYKKIIRKKIMDMKVYFFICIHEKIHIQGFSNRRGPVQK